MRGCKIMGINALVVFGEKPDFDFGRMEARMSCVRRKNNGTEVLLRIHLLAKMRERVR